MSSIINRTKGSSHPTPPGGIYVGVIKTVAQDGRVYVTIPKLGNTIGPIRVTNLNLNNKPTIGTQVLCAYTNMSNDEMYVIGNITPTSEAASGFQYALGDTGPAGGVIFYNKGKVSNGWQYLEATPDIYQIGQQTTFQLLATGTNVPGARYTTIGYGLENSLAIKAVADSLSTTCPAVDACLNLEFGGLSDWFLPSLMELKTLYDSGVIEVRYSDEISLGTWTSSQGKLSAQAFYIQNGSVDAVFKSNSFVVRPVRRF